MIRVIQTPSTRATTSATTTWRITEDSSCSYASLRKIITAAIDITLATVAAIALRSGSSAQICGYSMTHISAPSGATANSAADSGTAPAR